jgi:hypothetical protein
MVETRANRRKSLGHASKASSPQRSRSDTKNLKSGGDLHWSGAKKGGARGSSLLANLVSTGGVLALIATTPFIAIIVCVLTHAESLVKNPKTLVERKGAFFMCCTVVLIIPSGTADPRNPIVPARTRVITSGQRPRQRGLPVWLKRKI